MRSSLIYLLILFVALFSFEGCAVRPAEVGRPKPALPGEWLARLDNRADYWQSYQANLHIKAESSKGKLSIRAVILARLPDRFRLEAFNLLGQTVALLVFNRDGSTLWIPSERKVYTAARAEDLISHFLGVPLPLETFGYSLTACVPPHLIKNLELLQRGSEWQGASRSPLMDWAFLWTFLPDPFSMKAIDVREGRRSYTVTFDPPTPLDLPNVPGKIIFLSSEWRMEVQLDQLLRSPDLGSPVFDSPSPTGIQKIDLDRAR